MIQSATNESSNTTEEGSSSSDSQNTAEVPLFNKLQDM
jgi:hypothetical protein